MNDIVVRNRLISEDKYGFVSLTDMWEAAGRPASKTPARWQQHEGAKALIAAYEKVSNDYLLVADTQLSKLFLVYLPVS